MFGRWDLRIGSWFRWGRMEAGNEEKLDPALLLGCNDVPGRDGDCPGAHKVGDVGQRLRRGSALIGKFSNCGRQCFPAADAEYTADPSYDKERTVGTRRRGAAIPGELRTLPPAAA